MRVIDSHTEGEPTRLIIEGGPQLGRGPLSERRDKFARAYDRYRRFCINEPRGYDALVGALLCEPEDPGCVAGLIFFNNVGFLGMCGHGTIGPGTHRIETPVGVVTVELTGRNDVTIENVSSYLYRKAVTVEVPGMGTVTGDVAWGGNWFFLCTDAPPCPLIVANIGELTRKAEAVKAALVAANRTLTAATSCYAQAAHMTARLAAPAPAPKSPASRRQANYPRAQPGCRRASSTAASPPATAATPPIRPPPVPSSPASQGARLWCPSRCSSATPMTRLPMGWFRAIPFALEAQGYRIGKMDRASCCPSPPVRTGAKSVPPPSSPRKRTGRGRPYRLRYLLSG
jgi:Proline racemase